MGNRLGLGRLALLPLLAAALALAGCSDLFGPSRTATPQLQGLAIPYLSTTSGIMWIDGVPADASFRLGLHQRVPVLIEVSSGDRENAGLYRKYCPARERGPRYLCFEFDLIMQSGVDARTLGGYVAGAGGRLQWVCCGNSYAGAVMFSPEDLVSRARRALTWPGVADVELGPIGGCAGDGGGCINWSALTLPVYVDTGAAIAGDGTVQVRPGDTVTVSYTQPHGPALQAQFMVPIGP